MLSLASIHTAVRSSPCGTCAQDFAQMQEHYEALWKDMEATRCRLTQALRMHDQYRELTDLQRARIRYLEAGKPSPAVSHGEVANEPMHRAETLHAKVTQAPVRAPRLPRLDLVGPGGAVPTDEARLQQGLCQNPACTVTPRAGRSYCSGGCATKHRWAEEKRARKSVHESGYLIRPDGSMPIDQDRLQKNLCQHPSCAERRKPGRSYCSYSCSATHRAAVRRQQLDAAREGEPAVLPVGPGPIFRAHDPPAPVQPDAPPHPSPDAVSTTATGTMWDREREIIVTTLAEKNGNRTHAARELGISIRTIRNKLREYREMEGSG